MKYKNTPFGKFPIKENGKIDESQFINDFIKNGNKSEVITNDNFKNDSILNGYNACTS